VSHNIAEKIKALRKARRWKQTELAERLGAKQSMVARWENPKYENHTLKTIGRIATVFGVSIQIRIDPS